MSASNAHVKWAQRKDKLFVTVEVTDSKDVKVDFGDKSIAVTGSGVHKVGQEPSEFKTNIALSDKIDPATSTFKALGFSIQICCIKHDPNQEHWERLTEEPIKACKSWVAVDWSMWKDEEDEIAGEKTDFGGGGGGGYGDMGGMGGGGMPPGMGGMGGMPGMGGGMGGMPGMGGPGGMGGMDMQQMMAAMGGMGGAGGMGGGMGGGMPPGMEAMMGGMGGAGGEGEEEGADSDDEAEPPNLEDVEANKAD